MTLEDAEERELARWGDGEGKLPEALAAPVWGRYALFRGHPRITGLVMWDVHERQVVVAGERGGQKFDEVLSAPRPPTGLGVIPAAPTTSCDTSSGQAAPADRQSSLPARDAGEISRVCEHCGNDPAALVRLPAMNAERIERVASPAEFSQLIDALPLDLGLPYTLAGYAMGRRAQIVRLRWDELDLDPAVIEWGVEWEARKYEASRRVVPIVAPLLTLLKRRHLELGRPTNSLVCPPHTAWATSGLLNTGWVATRARKIWTSARPEPITLQEARHSAATWLDAAGVRPKVASVLMGHSTPARQPGAAPITLTRYTHALPADFERARGQLNSYLAERAQERSSVK